MRKILESFLDEGNILYSLENNKGIENILAEKPATIELEEIIILCNEKTASSSEILMTGLKENLSNVNIVGQKTFGKGVVTNIYSFDDGTGLMLIDSKWLTPKGNSVSLNGYLPDVVIDDKDDALHEVVGK